MASSGPPGGREDLAHVTINANWSMGYLYSPGHSLAEYETSQVMAWWPRRRAGQLRTKETLPVGSAPERIRLDITELCANVAAQVKDRTWSIEEIAAKVHHRLVWIHPFTNGNGRFCRVVADLMLIQRDLEPFAWGENLERTGEDRARYIAALQAADKKDYRPLFKLLGIPRADLAKK